jgi:hypothetical protein
MDDTHHALVSASSDLCFFTWQADEASDYVKTTQHPILPLILSHCHFHDNTTATDVFPQQFYIYTQVSVPTKKGVLN